MLRDQQAAQMADWARALLESSWDGSLANVPDVEQFRNRMRLFSDRGWVARFPQASLDEQYKELKRMYDNMVLSQQAEMAMFGRRLSAAEAREFRASLGDLLSSQ